MSLPPCNGLRFPWDRTNVAFVVEFRLGIDIGRVLIAPDDPSAPDDTSFLGSTIEDAVRTPACDGVFEVVPTVVSRFEGRVWLISKCGPRVQEKTRRWLAHHQFFERTGVDPTHLRFCLERPQKALHCADLGITHFIDDRRDVLEAMQAFVPNLYLFGPQSSRHAADSRFVIVETWHDVERSIP